MYWHSITQFFYVYLRYLKSSSLRWISTSLVSPEYVPSFSIWISVAFPLISLLFLSPFSNGPVYPHGPDFSSIDLSNVSFLYFRQLFVLFFSLKLEVWSERILSRDLNDPYSPRFILFVKMWWPLVWSRMSNWDGHLFQNDLILGVGNQIYNKYRKVTSPHKLVDIVSVIYSLFML